MQRVVSYGEVVPGPILSEGAATPALELLQGSKRSNHPDVTDVMERGRTGMTPSRVGSATMAPGASDHRHLSCPPKSIAVPMGDVPWADQESGSTGGESRPHSSKAQGKR